MAGRRPSTRFLTTDELRALFRAVRDTDGLYGPRDTAIYRLILCTGARASQLVRFSIPDAIARFGGGSGCADKALLNLANGRSEGALLYGRTGPLSQRTLQAEFAAHAAAAELQRGPTLQCLSNTNAMIIQCLRLANRPPCALDLWLAEQDISEIEDTHDRES